MVGTSFFYAGIDCGVPDASGTSTRPMHWFTKSSVAHQVAEL